jgi:hypothetical protein
VTIMLVLCCARSEPNHCEGCWAAAVYAAAVVGGVVLPGQGAGSWMGSGWRVVAVIVMDVTGGENTFVCWSYPHLGLRMS